MDLHHFGIWARNGKKALKQFTEKLRFRLFAERQTQFKSQWAVRNGNAVFVITGKRALNLDSYVSDSVSDPVTGFSSAAQDWDWDCQLPFTAGKSKWCDSSESNNFQNPHLIDTVNNICFSVKNVKRIVERVSEYSGAEFVLKHPTVVADSKGPVEFAIVQTGIGNIIHTLIDTSQYSGAFLPGFSEVTETPSHYKESAGLGFHFDHVTYAVPANSSKNILPWYEYCLGLQRFLINR